MAHESMVPLDGETAAKMLSERSDRLCFPLNDFCLSFGISPSELLKELQTGRLVTHRASAQVVPGDITSGIVVLANSVVAWMANPETPGRLLAKVDRHWASKKRPN